MFKFGKESKVLTVSLSLIRPGMRMSGRNNMSFWVKAVSAGMYMTVMSKSIMN